MSVMSQQYNCLIELYTIFLFFLLFMKMYLPSSFILRYDRAEMNVHAFMNELDQKDYTDIQEKLKIVNGVNHYNKLGDIFHTKPSL